MRLTYSITFGIIFLFLGCSNRKNDPSKQEVSTEKQSSSLLKDTGRIKQLLRQAYDSSLSNTKVADDLYRLAYRESDKIRYHDGVVNAILGITNGQFELGKYDSCEFYYQIAEKNALNPNFSKRLYPTVMLNKGSFYYIKGDLVNANKAYYLGLDYLRKHDMMETEMPVQLLYNLSLTDIQLNKLPDALQLLKEGEPIASKLSDSSFIRMLLTAEAEVYLKLDKVDSADGIIARMLASPDPLSFNDITIVVGYLNRKKQYERSLYYLEKELKNPENINVAYRISSLKILMGTTYYEWQKFDEAAKILRPALKESLTNKFYLTIPDAYSTLIKTETQLGNYKEVARLQEDSFKYKDSVLSEENKKALEELNIKYQTAEKDRQLSSNKLELLQQKSSLERQKSKYVFALVAAFFLGILALFISISSRQKAKMKEKDLQLIVRNNEINNLQSKVEGEETERRRLSRELHDGIGAMIAAAINHMNTFEKEWPGVTSTEKFKTINAILTDTAKDVKTAANNLHPHSLEVLGLKDAIIDYALSMQKTNSLDIHVQVFGDLTMITESFQLIFYRIVQELIHNVAKHANATNCLVQLTLNNNIFTLTVEDNGEGFDTTNLHQGMGYKNINQRVKNIGGEIEITSTRGKGTTVYIQVDEKIILNERA